MSATKGYLTQLHYDGYPRQIKGYRLLQHARSRATLYMKEGERYHPGRYGVKIFEADFDALTLTKVDERGRVVPDKPTPGQDTLF